MQCKNQYKKLVLVNLYLFEINLVATPLVKFHRNKNLLVLLFFNHSQCHAIISTNYMIIAHLNMIHYQNYLTNFVVPNYAV